MFKRSRKSGLKLDIGLGKNKKSLSQDKDLVVMLGVAFIALGIIGALGAESFASNLNFNMTTHKPFVSVFDVTNSFSNCSGTQYLGADGACHDYVAGQWADSAGDIYFNVGNVGVGTTSPSEKLHVSGATIVGAHEAVTPVAGTIEWDGTNFRGYDGSVWSYLDNDAGVPYSGASADLDLGANNLLTSGMVDGVDVSDLGAAVSVNQTNITLNSAVAQENANDIASLSLGKADRIVPAAVGNLAGLDTWGDLQDSGLALDDNGNTTADLWSASKIASEIASFTYTETDPIYTAWDKSTGISITESQISDLGTYVETESDPVYTAWDKSTGISIASTQVSDWATATSGFLTSYTETDPIYTAWDKSTGITITESQISDLGTYLETETDPVYTAWDKSTGISITESQVSDLQAYLLAEADTLDDVVGRGATTATAITVGGLTVDTDTLAVDSVNNRVGVGVASPSAKFHIETLGGANNGMVIESTASTHGGYPSLDYKAATSNYGFQTGLYPDTGQAFFYNNEGGLLFATSSALAGIGAQAMLIDGSQRVKIGSGTPAEKLDVTGNIAVSGTVDGVDVSVLEASVTTNTSDIATKADKIEPSADASMSAATALSVTDGIMRVVGNGGAVTMTATPNIADGADGQIVILQGTNDTNLVTFQDESSLANSGLQLSGGVNFTLGKGDTLQLMYDAGDDKWYELTRSDN